MISNTFPFFFPPYVTFSFFLFFFSLVFYPPHMCTLFCPHPLLFPTPPPSRRLFHSFLFPFSFSVCFQKALSIPKLFGSLNFFSLIFFFFFHLISKRSPLPLLDLYEANCSRTWTENWEASRPELNTVDSVFLRLHLLLLSFCLSMCLWLFGRGFVLFDFCIFGLWFVFWVMILIFVFIFFFFLSVFLCVFLVCVFGLWPWVCAIWWVFS